ncbi:MAG TPA: putative glycolipid-binding domain-containing protein [Actinomycetota bacterium]|nr:putative glycolipid-binding domain-containing protein [Actinomycetota bacterium]
MERLIVWKGVDAWRAEVCRFWFGESGIQAEGTQIGVTPLPYRMDYRLDAPDNYVTRRLQVEVAGEGWKRRLVLASDGNGAWQSDASAEGDPGLPPPGGELKHVAGALDCDLGLCPATNLMPVVRHGLHRQPGAEDFLMAWVSVPDLGVHPSRQRYEHVRLTQSGAVVRYVGEHRDFVGDLEFDRDGVVVFYPDLARRVGG